MNWRAREALPVNSVPGLAAGPSQHISPVPAVKTQPLARYLGWRRNPLSPVMAEPLSALGSGASGGGGTRFTLYSPRAATLSPFRREILRTLNSRLGFFKDRILRLLNFVSDMDSFLEPVSYFLVPDGS